MRYHYLPIRMAKMNKIKTAPNFPEGVELFALLVGYKIVWPL